MIHAVLFAAALVQQVGFPTYSSASIANPASNQASGFALNSFVSIYGENLSYYTRAVQASDISGGQLPTALAGTGVRVLVNNVFAPIYYVSPTQINVLVPTNITAGPAALQVVNSSLAGPPVTLQLTSTSPTVFEAPGRWAIATHADGTLLTTASPAAADEIVVIYACGLGPTQPAFPGGQIVTAAAVITTPSFGVWLNGSPVETSRIKYAGATPGFAGLYQINVQLPATSPNPELRIGFGAAASPTGLQLATSK